MHGITTLSPFAKYGFDIEVEPTDSFVFVGAGGIFLLKVTKTDGQEIVERRMLIEHDGSTVVFDTESLSKYEKELHIRRLKRLGIGTHQVSSLLGIGYAYVSKIKLDPTK